MKIRLLLLFVLVFSLAACSTGTSYRGNKRVTQGISYMQRGHQDARYEFTSLIPNQGDMVPSVQEEQEEGTLGEDEDFTSEYLSNSYGHYGDVVVTVSSRKFQLGDSPNGKMPLFMKSVEAAYARALRTYRPSGFTYAMSSVGAVNPLSDVQVHCRMSERSANDNGQTACNLFFQTIRSEFLRLQGAKS
ncbi:MAG: hypothetical protein IKP06_02260 [Elusimicrobiaceae bacterium]|nr:hypothetical protein [Elusimicrobiaceae bacterium]